MGKIGSNEDTEEIEFPTIEHCAIDEVVGRKHKICEASNFYYLILSFPILENCQNNRYMESNVCKRKYKQFTRKM